MAYEIHFEPKAIKRDLPKIPVASIDQIMRAIHERLTVDPIRLGKPLTGEFAGMRRLRVGNWRVIYDVSADKVFIHAIKLRRDAYKGW